MSNTFTSVASQLAGSSPYEKFVGYLGKHLSHNDLPTQYLHAARELAQMCRISEPKRCSLLLVMTALLIKTDRGSTSLSLKRRELQRALQPLLWENPSTSLEQHLHRIQTLLEDASAFTVFGEPGEAKPIIRRHKRLYLHDLYTAEKNIAEYVKKRTGNCSFEFDDGEVRAALTKIDASESSELTSEQKYGLLTSLYRPFSLISGGPGTGKTSLVASFLNLLEELGDAPERIALAAPTGKAADKLEKSIGVDRPEGTPSPMTVHRLLEYSPSRDRFNRNRNNPLGAQTVIVDEASMLDIHLLEGLINAMPDDHRLVLVGDPDQLPAVQAGALFPELIPNRLDTTVPWRDLIANPLEKTKSDEPMSRSTVFLTENFRLGAANQGTQQVAELSETINSGDTGSLTSKLFRRLETLRQARLTGVEILTPTTKFSFHQQLRRFARWWHHEHLAPTSNVEKYLFKPIDEESPGYLRERLERLNTRQLLCFTNIFSFGAKSLNKAFHQMLADEYGADRQTPYLPGEPIIVTQNDYDRDLFNGDQGMVVRRLGANGEVELGIFLRDGRIFPLGEIISMIEHAYALTIHKAQGSEFDHVAVVLPNREISVTSRELLYTGVTRCRESILFVGSKRRLREAIDRPTSRDSGLLDMLSKR